MIVREMSNMEIIKELKLMEDIEMTKNEFKIKVGNEQYETAPTVRGCIKIKVGEDLILPITTNEEADEVFGIIVYKIVETGYPLAVIEAILEDGSVGYFGFAIWAKNDDDNCTTNTFYLDTENNTNLVRYFNQIAPQLIHLFLKRWGYIPYMISESQSEITRVWTDAVYRERLETIN